MKIRNTKYKIQNTWSQLGSTLIELLMYMGLFAILLLILLQVFSSIIQVQLDSEATSSISQDGQYILSRLTYDILRSTAIVIPSTLGASSSALTLTINNSAYAYIIATSGGKLVLGTDNLNSYNTTFSNFSVTKLASTNGLTTLTFSFALTSVAKPVQGPRSETFKTTVGLRR